MNFAQVIAERGVGQVDIFNPAQLQQAPPSASITSEKYKSSLFDKNSTFIQQMLNGLLENGYTKADLSIELEISVSTLNRVARGAILQPANKTFSKLLRLYCATVMCN